MTAQRRLNVFWRQDGQCLFEEGLGNRRSSQSHPPGGRSQDPSLPTNRNIRDNAVDEQLPDSATLWSLVQVFVQFAREVQGGRVRRLLFRNKMMPVGRSHTFGATARKSRTNVHQTEVHVAHDDLFVATVTEIYREPPPGLRHCSTPDAATSNFLQAVLEYFAEEQAKFTSFHASRNPRAGNSDHANGPSDAPADSLSLHDEQDEVQPGLSGRAYSSSNTLSSSMTPSDASFVAGSSGSRDESEHDSTVQLMPLNAIAIGVEMRRYRVVHNA